MPLCDIKPGSDQPIWALWRIDEPPEELGEKLLASSAERSEFDSIHHPRKKLEWLASRLIIQHLVQHFGDSFKGLYKDAFGKPHLIGLPYSISIAHCFPFAVGIISKDHPTGIDIEQPRDKLLSIRHKFLSEQEAEVAGTDLQKLCKFWTAKEVLYKIYGRKKLIFKEHMELVESPTDPRQLAGRIRYFDFFQEYQIRFHQYQGHYIAYGVQY
jgi:phosphopantetheinyl transferase